MPNAKTALEWQGMPRKLPEIVILLQNRCQMIQGSFVKLHPVSCVSKEINIKLECYQDLA